MQSFFPEFESGQVLTNAHLNQLGNWLNEQQQATRRKLLGIGIVCGLETTRTGNRIRVERGVAVTSAGHLVCREQTLEHERYRPYSPPVSAAPEDQSGLDENLPPPLPAGEIPLWELLTDDAVPAAGEVAFSSLDAAFLADKVVMLLLEVIRESLKSCDVTDCADKGARRVHTVRTLLIREEDARALWQQETAEADALRPRDLEWQALRDSLMPASMPRLPLAANAAASLREIRQLAVAQTATGWQRLREQLQAGFKTYGYLLRTRFPAEAFPIDPWHGLDPVPPQNPQQLSDLMLDIHRYDLLQDGIASWHEFLGAAGRFEALCCPDPRRFPFHVLLGKPQGPAVAVQPGERRFGQVDFDLGAQRAQPYLRHPFYPAMEPTRQNALAADMLDLYYRTWLLFQRYRSDNLLEAELRITPSTRRGPLSGKAIPYYLAFAPGDNLHRNWHPQATRSGLLRQVQGHALHDPKAPAAAQVPDGADFYRIEGLLGRPLGQTLGQLQALQRAYGIGFGIEPVFVPVDRIANDEERGQLLALLQRDQTLVRLFKCKLRDLDVIFLILLGFVFQLLVSLVYLLGRMGQSPASQGTAGPSGRLRLNPALLTVNAAEIGMALNSGDQATFQAVMGNVQSSTMATFLQKQIREGHLQAMDVLDTLDEADDPNGPNAAVYRQVRAQTSGDLLQRVRGVMGNQAGEQQLQQTYYSMRMLQRAESMLQQSAVDSVTRFDFDRFDSELADLRSAWQGYKTAASQQAPPGAAQAALDSNMSLLGNVSGSALLTNLRTEFVTRMTRIFGEFMLDGYNRRFPGLEHRCGVPEGGTLVLAYTHRALLQEQGGRAVARPGVTGLRAFERATVLQPAETGATGGRRIVTDVLLDAAATDPRIAELHKQAEAAAAARVEREAELAAQEATLKLRQRELAILQRQVEANRSGVKKAQLSRERLDTTANATLAAKRAATLALKEAEIRLKTESEKLAEAEKQGVMADAQVKKAGAALEKARAAEEKARVDAEKARAEAAEAARRPTDAGAATAADPESSVSARAVAALAQGRLAAALDDDDPLNDLVIVADFCLPTYCCDSDCAELAAPATAEPPRDTPAHPITVSGSIVGGSRALTHLATARPIADATLQVLDQNQQVIGVKMSRGAFVFKARPGTYTLVAGARGYRTRQDTLQLDAPLRQELVITLQPG